MLEDLVPVFQIETSAKENYDKYNEYMRNAKTMDDVKRCRLTFEGYLKSCSVLERERRRFEKSEERESVSFAVGD